MGTSAGINLSTDMYATTIPPFAWSEHPAQKSVKRTSASATATPSSLDESSAREQVLLDHMAVVRFVARRIHDRLPQHVELDDLVSAGVVGLIDAYNKFDANKNVQFRSYAQFRIRGAILDSLRTLDWGSRELRRKGRHVEEAVQRLTHRLSRKPSDTEVCAELGMALDRYQELLRELKSLEIGSLQETRSEDSLEEELAYVATAPEVDPLYLCMKNEVSGKLCAAIATLPEREARVLALYYVEEMTLKEIGTVLGLVESRVSQIRASAILTLRTRMSRTEKVYEIRPREAAKNRQPAVPIALLKKHSASHGRSALPVNF